MIECYETQPDDFSQKIEVAAIYVKVKERFLILQIGTQKQEAGKWGVPCGKLDPGENAILAAKRELFEETGISSEIEDLIPKGILYFRKPEIDYTYHMFQLTLSSLPEVQISSEHIAYAWVTDKEAEALPLMQGASDALRACLY